MYYILKDLASTARRLHRDTFYLQVVVECVLALLAAKAGLLEAAEWSRYVKVVVAVDPDRASSQAVRDVDGVVEVLGEDRGSQTVICCIF